MECSNDLNNITFLRYNNTWEILPTNQIDIDNDSYFIFESITPGFSTFAVVGSKVIEKGETYTDKKDEIPWILIIGFIISAVVILIIILFKARYIYIKKEEKKK